MSSTANPATQAHAGRKVLPAEPLMALALFASSQNVPASRVPLALISSIHSRA